MADFKLTISDPKTGKSVKKDITGGAVDALLLRDVGDKVDGEHIGFAGYEFELTGGSDSAGFPLKKSIRGSGRKTIFTYRGVGFSGRDRWGVMQRGLRVKKAVAGSKITGQTTQVNLKILKEGPQALFTEEKKEEKKEQ
ncbi:MAG TPA: S6e family ribosomal protein [Candidatus Nanoarchaeia archaeon]|nr:S6e family ribosomal protein [Candidatus Nanoarchaeia archaeon]